MSSSQTVIAQSVKSGREGVMGYFRPFSGFNKGKQSEFKERVYFTESKACPCSRESEQVAA